jgi:hypothetical protein
MAEQTHNLPPLPGTGVVGRGIYLRPHQTYMLKDFLFKRGEDYPYTSVETGSTFAVPKCYAINGSPPMPSGRMLNQTVIEETFERFDKRLGLDLSVAGGSQGFSIDAQASQAKQLRSEDEAYYALRSSFVPFWDVYLPDATQLAIADFEQAELPTPFRHSHRREYEQFFERYGTHYVRRAWVGGSANLTFVIDKSANMTKDDIKAGIKASIGGVGSIESQGSMQEEKEKLQQNSECQVQGKGGDELRLAMLSSLDENAYSQWVQSIKENPSVIELDVIGIWTLCRDPDKALALQKAYEAGTMFRHISSMFYLDRRVYILRGDQYFYYDLDSKSSVIPSNINTQWPCLAECGFDRTDAAVVGHGLHADSGEDLSRKLFLFQGSNYVCMDVDRQAIDAGYPKPIAEGWPGVTFGRIDAAVNGGLDYIYFFSGDQYVRFNVATNRVDDCYPDLISNRWAGLSFERIDAALHWFDGKVYFFREDQYIRYDMTMYRADPGYPKYLIGEYVEDWNFFG